MVFHTQNVDDRDEWFWNSRRCGVFKIDPYVWPASERCKPVPMQSMKVSAGVKNGVMFGEITQNYSNKGSTPLELKFLFDAENCSVGNVSLEIEGKVTRGIVKGAEEAQDIYDDALAQGQQATIMKKKSTPKGDYFELVLGNLAPGLDATIKFKFMSELRHTLKLWGDDGREAIISLPVTSAVIDPSGSGLDLELRVDLGSTIEPSTVHCISEHKMKSSQKNGVLTVRLDPKQAASVCDTLRVAFPMPEEYRKSAGWATLSTLPDGMEAAQAWECSPFDRQPSAPPAPVNGAAGEGGASGEGSEGEHAVSVVFAPEICAGGKIEVATDAMMQREMIFVIDRSGSMSGGLIKRARSALELLLHSMTPGCKFNVISFGSSWEKMYPTSMPYSQVKDAVSKVRKMEADFGGTQLLSLFSTLLGSEPLKGYPRQVFLLTDGGVSDTKNVLDVVDSKCKDTRIFTVGLGSSASSELLTGMSKRGSGEVIHLDGEAEMAGPLMDQMFRASSPAITDVQIDWGDLQIQKIYAPGMNRDPSTAYLGQVITASTLLEALPVEPCPVTLRAKVGDADFAHTVVVDPASLGGCDVACHLSAAKREITALERTEASNSKVGTKWSVKWGMVSKFASCVAVDEKMRGAVVEGMEEVVTSACSSSSRVGFMGSGGEDCFDSLSADLSRVSKAMNCNIEKVLDRGERIESLACQSEQLADLSSKFQCRSRALKRRTSLLGGISSAVSNAGSAFMGLLSSKGTSPATKSYSSGASKWSDFEDSEPYLPSYDVGYQTHVACPVTSSPGAAHRLRSSHANTDGGKDPKEAILLCASEQQVDGSWKYQPELIHSLGLSEKHLKVVEWAKGLEDGVATGLLTALILAHLAGIGRESETKLVRFKARRFLLQWIKGAAGLGVGVPSEHAVPPASAGGEAGLTDEGALEAAIRALQS